MELDYKELAKLKLNKTDLKKMNADREADGSQPIDWSEYDRCRKEYLDEEKAIAKAEKEYEKDQRRGANFARLLDKVAELPDLRWNVVNNKYEYCDLGARLIPVIRAAVSKDLKHDYPAADVKSAVMAVATTRPYNPIVVELDPLVWDGTERIATMLETYCGVATIRDGVDISKALRIVSERFMIATVARCYSPGVQVDNVLILEGKQGIKKSQFVRVLGGQYYGYLSNDLADKDSKLEVIRKWIVELPELSAMRKSALEATKDFISRQVDMFRKPYAEDPADWPRHCVFIATINPKDDERYLIDDTGNRRWWPVLATRINIEKLKEDRDQLFAEALCKYRAGAKYWVDPDEDESTIDLLRAHQAPKEFAAANGLRKHIIPGQVFTTAEAMDWLEIPNSLRGKAKEMEVSTWIKSIPGIVKARRSDDTRGWRLQLDEGKVSKVDMHNDTCTCNDCIPTF